MRTKVLKSIFLTSFFLTAYSEEVNIEEKGLTEIPQAMPDDVKGDDSILAYRNYYIKYKKDFAKWTNRETPTWMMM